MLQRMAQSLICKQAQHLASHCATAGLTVSAFKFSVDQPNLVTRQTLKPNRRWQMERRHNLYLVNVVKFQIFSPKPVTVWVSVEYVSGQERTGLARRGRGRGRVACLT